MLGITPLVLIFLPLLFQLIFGTISIFKSYPFTFKDVYRISIIFQIVLSIVSFYIASYNFSKYIEENPNSFRCGMPFVGLIGLSLFCIIILFVIVLIQYFAKRMKDKKA